MGSWTFDNCSVAEKELLEETRRRGVVIVSSQAFEDCLSSRLTTYVPCTWTELVAGGFVDPEPTVGQSRADFMNIIQAALMSPLPVLNMCLVSLPGSRTRKLLPANGATDPSSSSGERATWPV
jgi:hypothetical protein